MTPEEYYEKIRMDIIIRSRQQHTQSLINYLYFHGYKFKENEKDRYITMSDSKDPEILELLSTILDELYVRFIRQPEEAKKKTLTRMYTKSKVYTEYRRKIDPKPVTYIKKTVSFRGNKRHI